MKMATVLLEPDNKLKTALSKKISIRTARIRASWDANETVRRAQLGAKQRHELVAILLGVPRSKNRNAVA